MPCALTANYSQKDCIEGIGGMPEAYIIESGNAEFEETAGVITAITNAPTKKWYHYTFAREVCNAKSTLTTNVQNGTQFHAHEIAIVLNKMKSATRNELKLLSKNNVYIIVKDGNGTWWLFGRQNGLDATGGGSDTGTAAGDRNGYTRTFTSNEPEMEIEVDADLIAALETAGVTP